MTVNPATLNAWVSVAVGVVAIAAALKSGYSGYIDRYICDRLRKAKQAHQRTEEIKQEVNDIKSHQQTQTDAIIQIGEMVGKINGEDFDAECYREEIGRDDPERFVSEDD